MNNTAFDASELRIQKLLSDLRFDLFAIEHLQLAEDEAKPKQSGNFETTTKTEGGKEIKVTRSPDGKFASKSGGGSASSESKSSTKGGAEPPVSAADSSKAIREGLTKVADDLKAGLAKLVDDVPDVRAGVQKAIMADIVGKTGDALTNARQYIENKLNEAVAATTKQSRGIANGETLFAGLAVAAVAGAATMALGASVPITAGVAVGFGVATLQMGSQILGDAAKKRTKEELKKFQESTPWVKGTNPKLQQMVKRLTEENTKESKQLLADIKTSVDAERASMEELAPKLVPPKSNEAAKKEITGETGSAIKNGLIAGAAENTNVAAGIKTTDMADVAKGEGDAFSNAMDFMKNAIFDAAKATSTAIKDSAIGKAIIGVLTAAYTMGETSGEAVGKFAREKISEALDSTLVDEEIAETLAGLTPEKVSENFEKAKAFMAVKENQEQVIATIKENIDAAVADIKSGKTAGDLKARVKDLGDRMNKAVETLQGEMKAQRDKKESLKQENKIREELNFQKREF